MSYQKPRRRGMSGTPLLTSSQVNSALGWNRAKRRAYWKAKETSCLEMGDEGACLAQVARHIPITLNGLGQDGGAAVPETMRFEVVVSGEPRGEYLYEDISGALDAAGMIRQRSGRDLKIVSPPGSNNVVADLEAGTGRPRMLFGIGLGAVVGKRGLTRSEVTRLARARNKALLGLGSGGILTDSFCNREEYSASWRDVTRGALSAGALASAAGGALAGVIGGFTGRPLISALLGAAVGYGAHAVWTGPYQQ